MKEFLQDTLELNKFLEFNNHLLNKNNLFEQTIKESKKLTFDRNILFNKKKKNKLSFEFSSLERIRIVVDSLMDDDVTIEELCNNKGISKDTFMLWKIDFLEAFYEYSEDRLVKEKLTLTFKELILRESNIDVYKFFKQFINLDSGKNLIIPKGEKLTTYSNFNNIENVIILDKINNFRQINKHLEEVNTILPFNGVLMGCFETFSARSKNNKIYNIPVLNKLYAFVDFLLNRACPKLPVLKKIYFSITKGRNRLLSKAESLGRLVSCGFDIIEYKEIKGIHYFVVKKVKEPSYDMSPSYGPLFKMKRVGKHGKIIGVYKFRTMHAYSEYLQDYVLKLNGYADSGKPADDFRIVPWGKFLRRYWLDEIPQLINVFKGELKLVGCRPVSHRYFQDIPEEIQKLRLTHKPGCIPPYVALNRSGAVDSVLEAEKKYLEEKITNPFTTDIKYFFLALYNILIKNKRSA